ncbi:Intraflagellar transport protein 46 [Borealophlyctis nickersoniae]|nr:Intraflagellar transport protein 46 [Borealophlyctis nickersoniae]
MSKSTLYNEPNTEDKASRINKVSNNYFDEALELSETDEVASEQSDPADGNVRKGDSPPSNNLSDSEEEYDHGDDEDEDRVMNPTEPRSGHPLTRPGGAGASSRTIMNVGVSDGNSSEFGMDFSREGDRSLDKRLSTTSKSVLLDDDDDEEEEEDDDEESEDNMRRSSLRQSRMSAARSFEGPAFKDAANDEMRELFQYIARYKPQEIDLDTELKPFIPDYIPCIGDIDAFIKVPSPDQTSEFLGLTVLDEPNPNQSDPSVLDLHLRALSKTAAIVPQTVRSIDALTIRSNPRALDTWIKSIRDLHAAKPAPSVHYSKRMPDIEDLMQVWPEEIEQGLKSIGLPSADLEMPLSSYATLLAILLDIPVVPEEKRNSKGPPKPSTNIVEALHVMFTLYSEFKNSAHFQALERSMGVGAGE